MNSHANRILNKVPLLLAVVMVVFGSILVYSRDVRGQERVDNEDRLERLLRGTERASTIAQIPPAFAAAVKREYEASRAIQQETGFDSYLASRYFRAMEIVDLKAGKLSLPKKLAAMCADGKCDTSLNPIVWAGAWTGNVAGNISNSNLPIATWTPGLAPNNNSIPDLACGSHASQAHHSIVPNGNDPVIPSLTTVAPMPATGNVAALRLGNRCPGYGAEKVTKTFMVAPGATSLEFWYAMVAQDPQHGPNDQPGFGAYLIDSNGNPVSGLIDIDPTTAGKQDFIVSDRNNPFFGFDPAQQVIYRPWTCVMIDLTGFEGQTLTLVLVNRDCGQGGHWGYTYIDSLCMGCKGTPAGSATFNPGKSDCARGEICFDYTVPKLANGTTGIVNLTLELYQNGSLVNTLTSGPLPTDGTFCFTNVTGGLNPSVGFDWRAIANFSITGGSIAPIEIGKKGEGFIEGKNNDCSPRPPEVDPCCPPWNKNQLQSMMFYNGSGSIAGPYTLKFTPSPSFDSQMKTYLSYLNSMNSAITSITIAFTLTDSIPTQIGQTATVTWSGSGSNIVGPNISPPTFYNPPSIPFPMQVGQWYEITTRIFVTRGQTFFPEKCAEAKLLVRVQVIASKSKQGAPPQAVLEFNDGDRSIKKIPVGDPSRR